MPAFPHTAIPFLSRNDFDNICFSTYKHPICPSFPFFYNIPFPKLIQNGKKTKAYMNLDADCVLSMNVFHI